MEEDKGRGQKVLCLILEIHVKKILNIPSETAVHVQDRSAIPPLVCYLTVQDSPEYSWDSAVGSEPWPDGAQI